MISALCMRAVLYMLDSAFCAEVGTWVCGFHLSHMQSLTRSRPTAVSVFLGTMFWCLHAPGAEALSITHACKQALCGIASNGRAGGL